MTTAPSITEAMAVILQRKMDELELSLNRLSLLTGMNRATLRIKLAHPGKFTLEQLILVAKALGTTHDALTAEAREQAAA